MTQNDTNIEYYRRVLVHNKLSKNPELAKEIYRHDVKRFIQDTAVTFDPRLKDPVIPFQATPIQLELLDFIDEQHKNQSDGIVEKSRGVGASFLTVYFAVHALLFREGWKTTFASRKASLVDQSGNMDSLFEKIRFTLKYIPSYLKPREIETPHMRVINNEINSSIVGESGPDGLGRAGRASIVFVDEAAFIEHAQVAFASLSQTSNTRIFVSTPGTTGLNNTFAKLRYSGNIPVFTLHWKPHLKHLPIDEEEWYEQQAKRYISHSDLARELDIEYEGSAENQLIKPEWVRAAIDYPLEEGKPHVAGADIAGDGDNWNVLVERKGSKVTDIQSWRFANTVQTTNYLKQKCEAKYLFVDSTGIGSAVMHNLQNTPERLKFKPKGVLFGSSPQGKAENDEEAKNIYLNRKAQIFHELARRFEKTYLQKEGIKEYPQDELISIPNNSDLISELSIPRVEYQTNGKMKIESKESLRKRGIASTDYLDALAIAFTNDKSIFNMALWEM